MPSRKCLASGSIIRTPSGEAVVEDISAQMMVIAIRNGKEVAEQVVWVGHRHIDLTRHGRPELAAPVRIRAGAIAEGQPSQDLLVSPEHALFIDGSLIQARSLINGGTIVQERATKAITYYHIELASHGVFFANDLPVESYLDNDDRSFFETDDQPLMLHPSLTPATELDPRMTDAAYAPFVTEPAALEPTWRRLAERSEALGYPRQEMLLTADANLHIVADGTVIMPIRSGNSRYVFAIPAGVKTASLVSRFVIPTDAEPYGADSRRLGVAVDSITIQSNGMERVIPADFPIEAAGWYDAETASASLWRWTDGTAILPLGDLKSAAIVTIVARTHAAYPIYDEHVCPTLRAA